MVSFPHYRQLENMDCGPTCLRKSPNITDGTTPRKPSRSWRNLVKTRT
ncbi:hypothetical protein [Arundinibacter roseus]|nr:hypothetical protein [Arundinibacter roseus]